jgi:molybdopterin-guanine dinucleotide biosynthesis protein A
MCEAAVFAGGEGRRIGGNKPMRPLGGRPLLAHVVAAIAPQVTRVTIVARTPADAETLRVRLADLLPGEAARLAAAADRPGLEGPVAALLGAADAARTPFLLTTPADTPFLPENLLARLAAALGPDGRAAVAADARCHPTIALYPTAALAACSPARSLMATIAPLAPRPVPFPSEALVNVNTEEDLAAAEARLARTLTGRWKPR